MALLRVVTEVRAEGEVMRVVACAGKVLRRLKAVDVRQLGGGASLRVKRSKSAFWVSSSTTLFFILSLLVPCFLGETPLKLWVAYQPKTQHINFLSTPSRFSSWVFHAPTQLIQETV
ncbi:hypothetical protein V6N13_051919 [Hibiscus sabdariffa]